MPNFKAKKTILHLVEWIVATLAAAALADAACFACWRHFIKNQFIDASVFGYFIVCCFLFVMIFTDEEFGKKVGHYVRGLGAALYLIAGLLILLYLDNGPWYNNEDYAYFRVLLAGIFSLANGAIFTAEFFILLFKKSLLDG